MVTAMGVTLGGPATPPAGAADMAGLLARLEALREEHHVPGFAVTLVDDQGPRHGAGGVADRASARPVTPDTPFRIGSITKTYNAIALLMLAERGRLSLDAPLRTLAPAAPLHNPWAADHPVRLTHLLEHTAGLLDLSQAEFDHNTPFADLESALAFGAGERRVLWRPGMHASYTNAGAGLAALALERLTGRSWEDFMATQVLPALDLDGTALAAGGPAMGTDGKERLATGYDRDGETVIPYWHMVFPAMGAINATPRQMTALLEMFLGRGQRHGMRVLAPASIARMERPSTTLAARRGLAYGYGAGLDQYLHGGFRFFGHGGDGDGYLSRFAYEPELGVGYFVTLNAFNHDALRAMSRAAAEHLLGDRPPPPPAPAVAVPRRELAGLTGTYEAVTRRFPWDKAAGHTLEVTLEDGRLALAYGGGRGLPLVPVGPKLFRHPREPVATMAFVRDGDSLYLQGDFGSYRLLRAAGSSRHTSSSSTAMGRASR